MEKAVLYARVSSDRQKKEQTIDSQVAELKRQIKYTGRVLVKEYIDDGETGSIFFRPALNELREDLKKNIYDAIYILCADRLAREVAYQNLFIIEFLKYKKQIVIEGRDYENNPENKFDLTIRGAVAELERAKIIERSQRGRKYWLKQGMLMSNGCQTFGYNYHRKTDKSRPYYTINKNEAPVVKKIFGLYAKGDISYIGIANLLKQEKAYRRPGTSIWNKHHVRYILQNEMYTGIRYFDTMIDANADDKPMDRAKVRKMIPRKRDDWIGIEIPKIISKDLFNQAKARLKHNQSCYRNAKGKQLLSGIIKCGRCGERIFSYRQYFQAKRIKTEARIYEKYLYNCKRKNKSCDTVQLDIRAIERTVFEMIEANMLEADILRKYIGSLSKKGKTDREKTAKQVKGIEEKIKGIKKRRERIIDLYAMGGLGKPEYLKRVTAYNKKENDLSAKCDELARLVPTIHKKRDIDRAINNYCKEIKGRLDKCIDFNTKRQFILDCINKVAYRNNQISVYGAISIGTTKLEFAIKKKIDRIKLRNQILEEDRKNNVQGMPIGRNKFGKLSQNDNVQIITPKN